MSQLLIESAVVGATIIPVYMLAHQVFPDDYVAVGVAGVSYHILSEMLGVNRWFLDNSVSSIKKSKEQSRAMMVKRRGLYNHWNDSAPYIPGNNNFTRNPMEDTYVANDRFSSSVAAPSFVSGSVYY